MEETRNRLDHETHEKIKVTETSVDGEILSLPPEIILDILKRLPVKPLLKFRCVSKSWLYMISSSEFIKTHLDYSTNNPNFTNHGIVHTISNPIFNLKHSSVHSLLFEDATVASDADYLEKNTQADVWVVGSCNGLICIANGNDIFLWNPSMRTSKKLPPLDVELKVSLMCGGFGFNEYGDDYKVMGMFSVVENSGVRKSTVKIYSLKADSWKTIDDFKGGMPLYQSGTYASGNLHFGVIPVYLHSGVSPMINDMNCGWNTVSLDLRSEEYGMVELPNFREALYAIRLGVLGGCLCVISHRTKNCGDVWVLKEYNVKESWTKVISIPYVNDPRTSLYSTPLLVLPNGEVLLFFERQFVVYNPKDNSFRRPEITNADHSITADVYVESLVSL